MHLLKKKLFSKARNMGIKEEETFLNGNKQPVKWEFINVSELNYVTDLKDGAELYSRIEEKENAEAYVYTINQKAENIFLNSEQVLHLA